MGGSERRGKEKKNKNSASQFLHSRLAQFILSRGYGILARKGLKQGSVKSVKTRTCMSRTSPFKATWAWCTLYSKWSDCETKNSSARMSAGSELGIRAANWSIEVEQFSVLVARKTQVSLRGAKAVA